MRRSRSRRLAALTLVGLAASATGARTARGQSPSTDQGAAFLLLPVGARAAAVGQAAITDAGTSEAVFWNPAGLATLVHTELAIHHYNSFAGPGDAMVLAVPSARLGSFAAAAYVLDYGNFDVTPPEPGGGPPPAPVGVATVRNVALSLSYATVVAGGVTAGIGYKLVQFRVDCSGDCSTVPPRTGTTHSVDAGVQVHIAAARMVVGVAVRNIGFRLQVNNEAQADALPTRLQAGASWLVVPPPAAREGFDVKVMADVRTGFGSGSGKPIALLGIDGGVKQKIRLRGGYAFLDSDMRGPSIGLGMAYTSFALDVARIFFDNPDLTGQEPYHISLRLFF